MILTNYTINRDLVSIEVEQLYLDLHNNYDYAGTIEKSNTVEVMFKLTEGDWVSAGQPLIITLKFNEVSYFDERGTASRDVDELGFHVNSTLGKVNYQGSNHPKQDANTLVIRFIGGSELAVACKESVCSIHQSV